MNCILLDKNKNLIGQFLYASESNLESFSINYPEAAHFLFFENDEHLEGDLEISEDMIVKKGKWVRVKVKKLVKFKKFKHKKEKPLEEITPEDLEDVEEELEFEEDALEVKETFTPKKVISKS